MALLATADGAVFTINNSAAETTIYSQTVNANEIADKSVLRLVLGGKVTNTTGADCGLILRLYIGGLFVNLGAIVIRGDEALGNINLQAGLNATRFMAEIVCTRVGTGLWVMDTVTPLSNGNAIGGTSLGTNNALLNEYAKLMAGVDFTVPHTIAVKGTLDTADAAITVELDFCTALLN